MVVTFRERGLEELFHDGDTHRIDRRHHRNCIVILDAINIATSPQDLAGVKDFHRLKGSRAGEYAMHVNGNWCITFRFDKSDVADVNFEDYH